MHARLLHRVCLLAVLASPLKETHPGGNDRVTCRSSMIVRDGQSILSFVPRETCPASKSSQFPRFLVGSHQQFMESCSWVRLRKRSPQGDAVNSFFLPSVWFCLASWRTRSFNTMRGESSVRTAVTELTPTCVKVRIQAYLL